MLVLDQIQVASVKGPIRTAFKTIKLPGKPRDETPASATLPVPFNVTVGCLGDVAFVGLGGEVFNELGRTIKSTSPFRHTFGFTHCNGAAGYVPTRPSYAEGGYEVRSSPLGARRRGTACRRSRAEVAGVAKRMTQ